MTWITGGEVKAVNGRLSSAMASTRYRALIPGAELARRGARVQVLSIASNQTPAEVARDVAGDVVIFSKSFNNTNDQLAKLLQARGARVVFDICDNHFENSPWREQFLAMAKVADQLTASTPVMADIICQFTDRAAVVIADPYEGPEGQPRFEPNSERLKLLWFGHLVNIKTVDDIISPLLALSREFPLELNIVTTPKPDLLNGIATCNRQCGPAMSLRLTPWSIEATNLALAQTDFVIIPSRINDTTKICRSANRLVESIRAGRFAVAHPIPSYVEMADFAWVNEDLIGGIRWALQKPQDAQRRIQTGQEYIRTAFSPAVIGDRWAAVIQGHAL